MKSARYYYKRWLIMAPVALVIIGFGACLIAEAAMLKASGADTWDWVGYGTIALVVFNSGISLFGGAVLHRVRFEKQRDRE